MDEMFITCILDIVDPKRELSPLQVIKLMEEKFTSHNTGSPKLPTLVECQMAFQSLPRNNGFSIASEKLAIEFVYDFICRQLRACQ